MIEKLYSEGVIKIEGISYGHDIYNYLTDKSNYTPNPMTDSHTGKLINYLEIQRVPELRVNQILEGSPKELREAVKGLRLGVHSIYCEHGFHMLPHRDFYEDLDTPEGVDGSFGNLMLYLNLSEDFTGRELVYGKFNQYVEREAGPFEWDDPRLEKIGEILPKTGVAVFIDGLNPEWWHGVTALTAGGPIIAVCMSMFGAARDSI